MFLKNMNPVLSIVLNVKKKLISRYKKMIMYIIYRYFVYYNTLNSLCYH